MPQKSMHGNHLQWQCNYAATVVLWILDLPIDGCFAPPPSKATVGMKWLLLLKY